MRVLFLAALLLVVPVAGAQGAAMEVLWTSTAHVAWASDPTPMGDGGLLIARQGDRYELVHFDLQGRWEVLGNSTQRLEDPVATGDAVFVVGNVDSQRRLLRVTPTGLEPVFEQGPQWQPAAHGGALTFVGVEDEAENIFRWVDGELQHLSPNVAAQTAPAIDDQFVAWTDSRSATPLYSALGLEVAGSAAHPNNIDIYAYHIPSGNVFPVAEENAQQEFPRFADDHRLVYRSIEGGVGRLLFMRDLGSQAGAGRVPVAPDATRVGEFDVIDHRVIFIDGPEGDASINVWDLDKRTLIGATGPVSSVIGAAVAGPVVFIERITPEGSVVDAVRIPTTMSVRFTTDGDCFEASVTGNAGPITAWSEPSGRALSVNGDRVQGCLDGDQTIRVMDTETMTAPLAPASSQSAADPSTTPGAPIALLAVALLLLVRQGR